MRKMTSEDRTSSEIWSATLVTLFTIPADPICCSSTGWIDTLPQHLLSKEDCPTDQERLSMDLLNMTEPDCAEQGRDAKMFYSSQHFV